METNNDSPNPIREDDWDEAAEENYPQELTEVLQAADVAEQLEQAQEEEYTPDWDGTDAEFVEDEDAAEYEEQYAGIKLSYTLNREEAMACLKRAHIYKTVGRRAWLETGILIVAAALFFVSFGLYQGGYNLALGILSLAVAAAVWLAAGKSRWRFIPTRWWSAPARASGKFPWTAPAALRNLMT